MLLDIAALILKKGVIPMANFGLFSFPMASIRKNIEGIEDSYRNPWDIYAELTQNAVDAIKKMQVTCKEEGKIELIINACERSITIKDNGCGISADETPNLLKLYSTGKNGDNSTVGEKGVGLKFAYFQSTKFEMITSDGTTGGRAIIKDALSWKKSSTNDEPDSDFEQLSVEEIEKLIGLNRGTEIKLEGVEIRDDESDSEASIFTLSFEQLKYVLRSATYLGDTSYIWGEYNPIDIDLTYTDYNGNEHKEKLQNRFVLPVESYGKNCLDIEEFEKWLREGDRTDAQKRHKLKGKILTSKGTYTHNGYREIKYWACFLPTWGQWELINKEYNLLPEDMEDEQLKQWKQDHSYSIFTPGIYTATKGMPTGITVDRPVTGYSGYWPNFFMIFQDDHLKFDIGRKTIQHKIQAIYMAKAKEIFSKIVRYVSKYGLAASLPSSTELDRYDIRGEIDKLVDLGSSKVSFVKNPAEQEASVAAVFYELIGNKTIMTLSLSTLDIATNMICMRITSTNPANLILEL